MFTDPVKESAYLDFLLRGKYKLYETEEQRTNRQNALRKLMAVQNDWACSVAKRKGASDEELKKSIVMFKVFGSFMLGVHFPDTDIDVICIFKQKYIT